MHLRRRFHKKLYLCKDCVEYLCSAALYTLTHAAESSEIGHESLIFAYKFSYSVEEKVNPQNYHQIHGIFWSLFLLHCLY